jgi:hypothetical protein
MLHISVLFALQVTLLAIGGYALMPRNYAQPSQRLIRSAVMLSITRCDELGDDAFDLR